MEDRVIFACRGLTKAFGGLRAVDGVDLTVREGELRALIGPNGAGKSTFFNLVTGQLQRDRGEVRFNGHRIDGLAPYQVMRKGIARTFQITSTFRRLTALENVQVALFVHYQRHLNPMALLRPAQNSMREEAMRLLEQVGLADSAYKPAGILAYGDQKRLELAIALASNPRMLLLDEPTAGMAPSERRDAMALIAHIARERGITLLFTEHDMDVVFGWAERITVMHQGKVLAEGPPEEVRANPEVQRVYLGEHG
ncbi:MAG: ABC transporter ATP-binding protein [Dehalococcoidia bacterium]